MRKTYTLLTVFTLLFGFSITQGEVTTANPTIEDMAELGSLAATGELTAVDKLESICELLYRGIDYDNDEERLMSNLRLMDAAMYPIGREAGNGSEEAMKALLYANSKIELRDFTSDAFGIAASMGNEEALDILINHRRYGILESSAVFALQKTAEKNNPRAVEFLVSVMRDQSSKALWHGASQGLVGAAALGNQDAIEALELYNDSK